MSKNLIPEIAKMLGVEMGEEFKIKHFDELTYSFGGDGLKEKFDNRPKTGWTTANTALGGLLSGKMEVVKLPWKPKEGETYWTFILYDSDIRLGIEPHKWLDDIFDFALFKAGWIYRSYEEAEAALPAVAKAMNIEYKI